MSNSPSTRVGGLLSNMVDGKEFENGMYVNRFTQYYSHLWFERIPGKKTKNVKIVMILIDFTTLQRLMGQYQINSLSFKKPVRVLVPAQLYNLVFKTMIVLEKNENGLTNDTWVQS